MSTDPIVPVSRPLEFREVPVGKDGIPTPSHFGDGPPAPAFTIPLALRSFNRGLLKRCPACGEKTMFRKFFQMEPECSNCGVVFSREQGSYTGAMYLNIIMTEFLFVMAFVFLEFVVGATTIAEIAILVPFNGLFPVWFFPRSRGLWAGVLYLCGDLYHDPL